MKRQQLILVALVLFTAGFGVMWGTGWLVYKLAQADDTGSQVKSTLPTTTLPVATKPTEPARPTAPKTVARTEPKTEPKTQPKATKPVPTVVEPPRDPNIPPDAELRRLVIGTLLDLDAAKKNKDYAAFASKMSAKRQMEDGKTYAENYGRAIPINLGQVKDGVPVFAPAPVLTDQGMLFLKGTVAGKTERIRFEFGYHLEQGTWKLHDMGQMGWQGLNNPM
jgi:hypothetical protein